MAAIAAERIRFLKPSLPHLDEVAALYGSVYGTGVITNAALVARFEAVCAERLQVKHCVAVSSCTSGLMLTMKALDLRGEVILPSFTFFATGHAALWNGLKPVFADCHPETWTLDPQAAQRRLTPATCAIVGVHLYGNPCDVDALDEVARKAGVKLLFDAAHGFGGEWQSKPIGGFGDAEVFSFTPTKTLVCGEGGLVATNDATLAHRVRAGRNYGDLGQYDPEVLGINARMTEFNAAMGITGMLIVDRKIRRHNEIARLYQSELADVPGLSFPLVREGNLCTYKDVSICVDHGRDALAALLLANGIETKKYFYPAVHDQGLYQQYAHGDLKNTERLASGVLSLPVYETLADEDVRRITGLIRTFTPQ